MPHSSANMMTHISRKGLFCRTERRESGEKTNQKRRWRVLNGDWFCAQKEKVITEPVSIFGAKKKGSPRSQSAPRDSFKD
jgi:hypothetical protein